MFQTMFLAYPAEGFKIIYRIQLNFAIKCSMVFDWSKLLFVQDVIKQFMINYKMLSYY